MNTPTTPTPIISEKRKVFKPSPSPSPSVKPAPTAALVEQKGKVMSSRKDFMKAKKQYLKDLMTLKMFRGKSHSKMVACQIMAFSVPPEDVTQYMNKRLGITDYPMHEHADIMGRFKIADDLHDLYFDKEAAALRRGQQLIGDRMPSLQESLATELAKRRQFIEPESEEDITEFADNIKTMETTSPAQMNVRIPPAPPAPTIKEKLVKAEVKELTKNTAIVASESEKAAVKVSEDAANKALIQVFEDKPIKTMTAEEKEIKMALVASSAGLLKEALMKSAEQMTLRQMQNEKLQLIAKENEALKQTLAKIESDKKAEVSALGTQVDKKEEVIAKLEGSPAVPQSTVDHKSDELNAMKEMLAIKERELADLRARVADAKPILEYKTITPMEVINEPAPAAPSLNFTRVIPKNDVPSDVSETALKSRKEKVEDFHGNASSLVKKHGKSAGGLFSRLLGSTTDSLERIIPVATDSANKALSNTASNIGPMANAISQNAVPLTSAGISVAGDISKYRQNKQMQKIKMDKFKAQHGVSDAKPPKQPKQPKPPKQQKQKKPAKLARTKRTVFKKRAQFETDYIGAEFGSSSDYSDSDSDSDSGSDDDDLDNIGAQAPRLELRKMVGDPLPDYEDDGDDGEGKESVSVEEDAEVRIDPRGTILVSYDHALMPPGVSEWQFPASLNVPLVLSQLRSHNMKIVILNRFYLFCAYYPRVKHDRAKDIVAMIERIKGVINVPAEITHDAVAIADDTTVDETRLWVTEMRGRNISEFDDFKPIHDFWMYLVLAMIRTDEHCRRVFSFLFDYSPSMCYEDASKIAFSERSAENIRRVMAQFHQ